MSLRYVVWFAGAGGDSQGAVQVPGVDLILAANHNRIAIESHALNFPGADHFQGDIRDLDVGGHPYGELFWASPECTNWTVAKGKKADYANHPGLWDDEGPGDEVERSRALMEDVVRYLRGMHLRQRPVLAGAVENVVDIRKWTDWDRWRGEIEALGYRTRLIALNSAHAQSVRSPRAPQSRDRLYLAYWHESLGRDPDWDRWLRPQCWCTSCGEIVDGIQTWKRPGQDMGRYNQQYYYRCPKLSCRGVRVEPFYLPAASAIDWSIEGQRIGDRTRPLSPKTMARIEAALRKWGPAIVEAGGNQYDAHDPKHPQHGQAGAYSRSWPVTDPLRTLHGTATKALVQPFILERRGDYRVRDIGDPLSTLTANETTKALLVPVEGREGKHASSVMQLLRTQTCRNDLALLTMLRGQNAAKSVGEPMDTVAASGNHHGLLVPAGGTWHTDGHPTSDPMRTLTTREAHGLLVPYYGTRSTGGPTNHPMGTLTTVDKFALVMRNNTSRGDDGYLSTPVTEPLRTLTTSGHQSLLDQLTLTVEDCLFRMLEPHEIGAGMAFFPDYKVIGTKRQRVKQYGNAVTPPVAEVIIAALVECIQGYPIDWGLAA